MPNWGNIGKILGAAGSIAAIPFTGGASATGLLGLLGKAAPALGAAGSVMSGIGAGRAEGRQAEATANQNQGRAQADIYRALADAIMRQGTLGQQKAEFERDSPNVRFGQAMRGNLAANMQDVSMQVPDRLKPYMVNFSGGLRPSAIGAGGRAAGQQLADLGSGMMGKDSFELPNLPAPPQTPDMPQAGWLDKFLNIAGPAASAVGVLGPMIGRRGQNQQAQSPSFLPGVGANRDLYRGLF